MIIAITMIAIFSIRSMNAAPSIESMITSSEVRAKIEKPLQLEIQNNARQAEKSVTVLIKTDEQNLDEVYDLAESEGKAIGKYDIGNIVSMEIPLSKIKDVAENKDVKGVWQNHEYHITLDESVPQINAPFMWSSGYNGSGIKIAIIDTGVDKTHPMLQGKVIAEKEFSGEGVTADWHGHGTHVAGIAAGKKNNGIGFNGVAPEALIMNARAIASTGGGTDNSVIAAINWAVNPDGDDSTDDGADIISMSLGGSYSDLNSPLVTAVRDAINKGVVVVIASGNCGKDCLSSSCRGYVGVETPGITPEAITVGAVDKSNNWACFSSGGTINNSGEMIIKPDVVAPGVNINSAAPNNKYAVMQGTSMATPHVAGAAALLLQANPDLSPLQVKEIMEKTAKPLGEPGKDEKYGNGLIDASRYLPGEINNFFKYKVDLADSVYQGDTIKISLNNSGDIASVNATIINPFGEEFYIDYQQTSDAFEANFADTSRLGLYTVKTNIRTTTDEVIQLQNKFNVLDRNLTKGIIKDVIVPAQVAYNSSVSIQVSFQNNDSSAMDIIMEAQIWDKESLVASLKNQSIVNSNSIATFNFIWDSGLSLGVKNIKVIASYNDRYTTLSRVFSVIDNISPKINYVNYTNNIIKNSPIVAEAFVNDISKISGFMHVRKSSTEKVSLKELYSSGTSQNVAGSYVATEIGTYNFWFELCDNNYCANTSEYSVDVSDCSGKDILLISESNEGVEKYNPISDDYCLVNWDVYKSGTPNLQYLNGFDAVIYTAPDYMADNINSDMEKVLIDYVNVKGSLMIEGANIAFIHGYDELMFNATNSKLDKPLTLNESNVEIFKMINHPVLKGILDTLVFNKDNSEVACSVFPRAKGIEILKWKDFNSSAVISEANGKTLFFSFNLNALDSSVKDNLIKNSASWLVENKNSPDLIINRADYGHLIEGINTIRINISNIGSGDAEAVEMSVFVDGNIKKTFSASIPAGETQVIETSLNFEIGKHKLKLVSNPDFNSVEEQYLNNIYETDIDVAQKQVDLSLNNLSYKTTVDGTEIIASVGNLGGISANAEVEFIINNESVSKKILTMAAGEGKNVNFTTEQAKGIYSLKATVKSLGSLDYNPSNNEIDSSLYVCNPNFNILIVSDNDTAERNKNDESANLIYSYLTKNLYCSEVWDESVRGNPEGYANDFDVIIWSTGNSWNGTIDDKDADMLNSFTGGIVFEGSDIAFDHGDDSFITNRMHASLDRDMMLESDSFIRANESSIFGNGFDLLINSAKCRFPDSIVPLNSNSIASWDSGGAAIVSYNQSRRRTVYFAFAIDCIVGDEKEKFITSAADWVFVLKGDANYDDKVDIMDLAKVGRAFGTNANSEDWDEQADLNDNGQIDIFDLATVGMNYDREK